MTHFEENHRTRTRDAGERRKAVTATEPLPEYPDVLAANRQSSANPELDSQQMRCADLSSSSENTEAANKVERTYTCTL